MNKKGHFAYNLGIWLGLLRASCGFDSRREYQKNHIFCGFLLFLGQNIGVFGIILNYSTISTPREKIRDTHNQVSIPIFYS